MLTVNLNLKHSEDQLLHAAGCMQPGDAPHWQLPTYVILLHPDPRPERETEWASSITAEEIEAERGE